MERCSLIAMTIDSLIMADWGWGINLSIPHALIKIDIEGIEMDALIGGAQSIQKFKPQLMIEKIKSNENDIREFIEKLGYKIFPLGINILAIHESDPTSQQIKINQIPR